jgi:hypothetical protein
MLLIRILDFAYTSDVVPINAHPAFQDIGCIMQDDDIGFPSVPNKSIMVTADTTRRGKLNALQ